MSCLFPRFRAHPSVFVAPVIALLGCAEDPTTPNPPNSPQPSMAAAAPGSWTTKAPLPTARRRMAGAVVRNSSGQYLFYAIGGNNETNSAMRRVEAYNAATNSWTRRANLPADRSGAAAAAIGRKIYVVGGSSLTAGATSTLFVYDQATNTWTQKASLPVNSVLGIAGVIEGRLYLVTSSSTLASQRLYRYNPTTNSWTRRADPIKNHFSGIGGVIEGKLYVAWGRSHTVDVYNPATNQWTTKLTYAYAGGIDGEGTCPPDIDIDCSVDAAASTVFQKKLWVIGGNNDDESMPLTFAYDPVTNRWISKASMQNTRQSGPIAGKVRNAAGQFRMVVTGGFSNDTGEILSATEMYAP